ncbi:MAG: gliding motility-associated C-terminal domain-containing protein, partial [Bacteroidota bacterium]
LSDLEVDLGEEQFLCEGDSIILRASNATEEAQYEWYKDGLLVSNDSTLLVKEPGNYGVKVENSCKIVEDQVSVSPIDFTNNLPSTLFACQGETQRLDATVAGDSVAYLWSNGSPEASILVDSSGIYSVRISKQNCEITQNVEFISLDLSFSIDLGSDTLLCAGEQLRLNASTPNGKYEWQDGSTDSIFVVNQAGTYWVEVSNDCAEARDSIVVAFKEFPQLDLGKDTTLCPGEVLNLDVDQAVPSTYLWSNGSTDAQISVSQSETLWVEVLSDGCIDRDTIQINFIEPISFDLGPDISICPEDVLTLSTSLNRSDVQYVWQDGSTDTSIVVNQPGTYWLEIYNDCQRIRDSVEVSPLVFPRVDFGADLVLCPGDSLLLDASNPSSTYLWHDGSTAATYLVTRPEVVTVEVRNANGCVVKESILIDYRAPLAPVNLGNDTTLCAQTSLVLNASSLHPEARYRWQDGSTDSIFVVTSPGLYLVEVFNTCESYGDEIQVDYYDLPVVDLGEDILACPGEQITLDARNPSSTYLWSDGSTNATFMATSSQTVWVEVMHTNGCTARDTIEVIFKPNPEIDFGPDVEICDGDQLVLNALQPFSTYLWQDGSTEPSFTVTQAGTYSVVVDNGCTQARGEITVGVIPLPFVNLGIDTLICFNQTLLLEVPAQENVTYEWQDGSKESSFLVTETGEYWVEVNRQGCIVRDEINILYIECFENLEIPNIITPNGDGKNEYFVIDNLDLRLWTLSIHDRHGSMVFESDNYQNNWDARDLPSDVYFYRLIKRGSDLEVKGWIKVMR